MTDEAEDERPLRQLEVDYTWGVVTENLDEDEDDDGSDYIPETPLGEVSRLAVVQYNVSRH